MSLVRYFFLVLVTFLSSSVFSKELSPTLQDTTSTSSKFKKSNLSIFFSFDYNSYQSKEPYNELFPKLSQNPGFRIGFSMEHQISKLIGIGYGLLFVQTGYDQPLDWDNYTFGDQILLRTGHIYETSDQYFEGPVTLSDKLIELPFVLSLNPIPRTHLFSVMIGIAPHYLVHTKAKVESEASSTSSILYSAGPNKSIERFNVLMLFGLKSRFNISDKLNSTISLSYRRNLTNLGIFENEQLRSLGIGIGIGRIVGK